MVYAVGSTILASNYNVFASSVSKVIGLGSGNFGYGNLSKSIPFVSVGGTVFASQWEILINDLDDSNVHQSTVAVTVASAAIPASSQYAQNATIIAFDGSLGRWNLPRNASAIAANRLNVAGSQVAIGTSVITSKRETAWGSQLVHEFTATFSDMDAARHFFNSGGQLIIHAERSGGAATPQNDDWTDLLANASTYVFDGSEYFAGDAATTDVQRFTQAGSNIAYATNDYTIFEKRDSIVDPNSRGGLGSTITFTVQFNDDHVGAPDVVDGSITNIVDQRISTGRISASGPTLVTLTELTSGS